MSNLFNYNKTKYKPYNRRKRKNEMFYVYILVCSHGAYYVGTTNNPNRRFIQHSAHTGAMWTKLHPPIKVYSVSPLPQVRTRSELVYWETIATLQTMAKVGWQRVRGGDFIRVSPEKTASMLRDVRKQRKYNYNATQLFGL